MRSLGHGKDLRLIFDVGLCRMDPSDEGSTYTSPSLSFVPSREFRMAQAVRKQACMIVFLGPLCSGNPELVVWIGGLGI